MVRGLRQLDGGVDVDAAEHAVAANVGVDDGLHAVVLKLFRQVHHLVAGEFAPAVGRHFAVLGVQPHDDVAAKRAASVFQKAGVFDGCGANDDVADAAVDVFFNGVQVADTATELHRDVVAHRFQDAADGAEVLRLASERAVQVDQVQTPRPFVHPLQGHFGGVFAENGGLVHIALDQANAVAVFEVNGGDEEHG